MSYSLDELFEFCEDNDRGGYAIQKYLKKDDPTVTELAIPTEYNGQPVTKLAPYCLRDAEYLMRVTIPESVRYIEEGAFAFCWELESVEFKGDPIDTGFDIFFKCKKLPLETYIMGLVRSTDITRPVPNEDLQNEASTHFRIGEFFRFEIFEFLAKNGNFHGCDLGILLRSAIRQDKREFFPIVEKYDLIAKRETADALIEYAVEYENTEITMYLLDLKISKFCFNEGDKYEL